MTTRSSVYTRILNVNVDPKGRINITIKRTVTLPSVEAYQEQREQIESDFECELL